MRVGGAVERFNIWKMDNKSLSDRRKGILERIATPGDDGTRFLVDFSEAARQRGSFFRLDQLTVAETLPDRTVKIQTDPVDRPLQCRHFERSEKPQTWRRTVSPFWMESKEVEIFLCTDFVL